MCDILFSSKPGDMPSLTLAQELETNQVRYQFATTYWNNSRNNISIKSPHYQKVGYQNNHQQSPQTAPYNGAHTYNNRNTNVRERPNTLPEATEVDGGFRSAMRSAQRHQPEVRKRPAESIRQSVHKIQRINNIEEKPTELPINFLE